MSRKKASYVELDENWAISSDSSQWKLCTIVSSGDKRQYQSKKYYPNLLSLFQSLYKMEVRAAEYEALVDIVDNQREALVKIAGMISKLSCDEEERREILSQVSGVTL